MNRSLLPARGRSRLRALFPLLVVALAAAAPAPAGAASFAPAIAFPAESAQMRLAFRVAVKYWGKVPCSGQVAVRWGSLDGETNATSSWRSATANGYATPETNSQCRVTFNRAAIRDWPMLCTIATHEVGHLNGHEHRDDPGRLMSRVYARPLPQCVAAARRAGLLPGTAAERVTT